MLNFLILSILSVTLSTGPEISNPDDIKKLLQKAEEKFENKNEKGALNLYLDVLDMEPENYEALWNASLMYSRIGFRFEDESDQKSHFERAVELAEKSVALYPDSSRAHYVMAVAEGRMADVIGTGERIETSHRIEENIKRAIELDPDYAPSWHLYGVWHSEVANITRAERIAARFISGGIPGGASNETAEEYLKKAIEINPDHMLFRLDLARHYERSRQEEKAIPVLEEILDMEPDLKDDPQHLEDARELLDELS